MKIYSGSSSKPLQKSMKGGVDAPVRTLLTPEGKSAEAVDRIMLLARWARHLNENGKNIIFAGMGKPTLATNEYVAASAIKYWSGVLVAAQKSRFALRNIHDSKKMQHQVIEAGGVIEYGDPRGDFDARTIMARALSDWYDAEIAAENVLFTVGGAGGLNNVFKLVNQLSTDGYIALQFPYYSLYAGADAMPSEDENYAEENYSKGWRQINRLHPIDVMGEPGYHLTAQSVSASVKRAEKMRRKISAFLFCDPNNPLGTIVAKTEWLKIAKILEQYPDVPIILDEAYAEMQLDGEKHISLFSLAPSLRQRIIVLRSATKALSAAGERMAIMFTLNEGWYNLLLEKNINTIGHAPRSLAFAFAEAFEKLDEFELKNIAKFYGPQVRLAEKRILELGIAVPDPNYKVEGSFYIIANLSELFGISPLNNLAMVFGRPINVISTDEEVVYYLLCKAGLFLAPLSYFGVSRDLGFVRITCSGGDEEIEEIMQRLATEIRVARIDRRKYLESEIHQSLKLLKGKTPNYNEYRGEFKEICAIVSDNLLEMKKILENLSKLYLLIKSQIDEIDH